MARPEIVGGPILTTGTNAYGLGLDIYVPSDMTTNLLWVVCGFRTGGGGTTSVLMRVDGDYSALSAIASAYDPMRMTSNQFANLSAGIRRVTVETSGLGYIESGFLCAVLFRNGSEGTLNAVITNVASGGNPTTTQRQALLYWSYGSSSISTDGKSILSIDVLPDSLGSLEVVTHEGTGGANYYGFNTSGEVSKLGAYIIVPYAA